MSGHPHDESRAAFEALFRATRTDLLAYVIRRSPGPEDAADILAETYLIAWRKLETIPKGDRARLWLFGVARNLIRRAAGRRRSGDAVVDRLAHQLRASQVVAADGERSVDLAAALGALSESDREILTLHAWEGLTPREIAVVLGMSANVERVRLHRARSRMRKKLDRARPQPGQRSIEKAPFPGLFP